MTANSTREITFVMNFDDYENCPEELKKYIMTNGRQPLNGVYTSTIAEGNESSNLSRVTDYVYNVVDDVDFGNLAHEDAIDKFEIYDIDLVIIDIEMPGIDGVETTKRLIQNHPEAKVLGFSMHAEEATIEAMIDAGAKSYILKNFGKEELIEAMEMVNNNQYFFSSEVSGNLLKDLLNKIKP